MPFGTAQGQPLCHLIQWWGNHCVMRCNGGATTLPFSTAQGQSLSNLEQRRSNHCVI